MANKASTKTQIVDSIKEASNILVTVSNNPSVDELSAALGLTIFLNKLDKHATAVASGQMPSAITFLEPDKTFESSADSLRDFIIALDKDKADHLRYKLDGDVVKIFITPYKTTITSEDLEFSQGDYNVELVLALNVSSSDDLDIALSAHGKILHDATVVTLAAGDSKSSLGTIDWQDKGASSVSEMVAEIIDALKSPKASLDEQISTALLTGIVASTDRFSNDLTSSRVMTIAAELMAAGANQQLIAAKLEEAGGIEPSVSESEVSGQESSDDGSTKLTEGESTKLSQAKKSPESEVAPNGAIGVMKINHARQGSLDDIALRVMEESQEDATRVAEEQLNKQMASADPQPQEDIQPEVTPPTEEQAPAGLVVEDSQDQNIGLPTAPTNLMDDLAQATNEVATPAETSSMIGASVAPPASGDFGSTPTIGGTLNATTAQAAEDKKREAQLNLNRTILSHGKPMGSEGPSLASGPLNATMADPEPETASVDIFAQPPSSSATSSEVTYQPSNQSELLAQALNSADPAPQVAEPPLSSYQTVINPISEPVSEQIPAPVYSPDPASAPVDATYAQPEYSQPVYVDPAVGAPVYQEQPTQTLADLEANSTMPMPPNFPAMPDFSNLPPLPPAPVGVDFNGLPELPSVNQIAPQQEFNPSQFQIPGQPQ